MKDISGSQRKLAWRSNNGNVEEGENNQSRRVTLARRARKTRRSAQPSRRVGMVAYISGVAPVRRGSVESGIIMAAMRVFWRTRLFISGTFIGTLLNII
jgi:hypothetical protein